MDEDLKLKIEKVLSYLSSEQKEKEILIEANIDNKNLISYLEESGDLEVDFEYNYEQPSNHIRMNNGKRCLWYKDINNEWVINLYLIKKLMGCNS